MGVQPVAPHTSAADPFGAGLVQPFGAALVVHDGGSEELLCVKEVARRLGVSTASVYRWAEEGSLPHVRLSSNILRFRAEDVSAFVVDRLR